MSRTFSSGTIVFACLVSALMTPATVGQSLVDSSSARYLPPEVSIVLTARDLGTRWNEIESSDVFQRVMDIPRVKQALADDKSRDLRTGQKFIESIFGKPIVELIQDFTDHGATLGWKSEREIVLLCQPAPLAFDQLKQTLKEFASAAALGTAQQYRGQLFSTTYRGTDAYGIDNARIGFCNGWVVVCSTSDIGKAVLDRLLGDKVTSVADQTWFQQAHNLMQSSAQEFQPTIVAMANLDDIRAGGKFKIPRGADPGQEILFGGILDALETAPIAVATVEINGQAAQVQLATPRTKRADDHLEYFFGGDQLQPAPHSIDIPNRIFSGRWHRDIGLFWKMAPQIIHDENALAGIAKSESDISTLLGGMVTVSELFQYLGPDVELVAVQPIAGAHDKQPTLQIPAFCITGTLRNAAKAQPALRLAFQQVVSFANLNASAGEYPPLEVTTEKDAGKTLISGSYFAMEQTSMNDQPGADLYKNFSPTLGFEGDQFVLASHRALAEQVLAATESKAVDSNSAAQVDNTIVELWPAELAAAGDLNREPLIAQRMLSSGLDRANATMDIDSAIALLKQFASVRFCLRAADDSLILELETRLATGSTATK